MRFSFTCTSKREIDVIYSFKDLFINNIFQGIEIFYPYNLDQEGYNNYTKAISDITDKQNIEIVLHLPHGGIDNDLIRCGDVIKRFYKAIDYGKMFNVKKYTLHLGSTLNLGQKEYLEKATSVLDKLCSYAYPSIIMIENMPSDKEIGSTKYELDYLLKRVNKENLGLIYDTGHGHVKMNDNKKERNFINHFHDYIYHFHINDNLGLTDSHSPIGAGNIDFKNLFMNYNYNHLICLEILYKTKEDLIKYKEEFLKALL